MPIIQATMDLIQLIDDRRYAHVVARLVEEVGRQLGGWIGQQRRQGQSASPA